MIIPIRSFVGNSALIRGADEVLDGACAEYERDLVEADPGIGVVIPDEIHAVASQRRSSVVVSEPVTLAIPIADDGPAVRGATGAQVPQWSV